MSNLQGIISKSADNASTQFETMAYLTTNAANYNTNGFKSERFENYLMPDGRIEGVERRDHSTGVFMETRRPLYLGIDGAGFFPVTKSDGKVVYTRDGSFKLNSEGYLVTDDNYLVGDGIKLPHSYYKLNIAKDGVVSVIPERDADEQVLGKIPLVNFNNPEGLKKLEGNKYTATNDSGEPILMKDTKSILQGNIERSNVNLFATVNDVLKINAGIIANTRIIKVVDELYRQAINLKQ